MGDKIIYFQILALYIILDLLIAYLTFSVVTSSTLKVMYSIFIFLLAYSIFGLYLFIQELALNYSGVSSTSINFTSTAGGNIQTLTAWGIMLVDIVAIGIYGYSMVRDMSKKNNSAGVNATTQSVAQLPRLTGGAKKK